MNEDNEPTIEVEAGEANYLEVFVKEYKPPRPAICRLFDKVKHKKSPEFIEDFKLLHPECF